MNVGTRIFGQSQPHFCKVIKKDMTPAEIETLGLEYDLANFIYNMARAEDSNCVLITTAPELVMTHKSMDVGPGTVHRWTLIYYDSDINRVWR